VYHCTGWKLGYCVAPAAHKRFRKVRNSIVSVVTVPSRLHSRVFKHKESYLSLPAFMQAKRDYFQVLMKETPFDRFLVMAVIFNFIPTANQ
jgi:methionine aminotransferase